MERRQHQLWLKTLTSSLCRLPPSLRQGQFLGNKTSSFCFVSLCVCVFLSIGFTFSRLFGPLVRLACLFFQVSLQTTFSPAGAILRWEFMPEVISTARVRFLDRQLKAITERLVSVTADLPLWRLKERSWKQRETLLHDWTLSQSPALPECRLEVRKEQLVWEFWRYMTITTTEGAGILHYPTIFICILYSWLFLYQGFTFTLCAESYLLVYLGLLQKLKGAWLGPPSSPSSTSRTWCCNKPDEHPNKLPFFGMERWDFPMRSCCLVGAWKGDKDRELFFFGSWSLRVWEESNKLYILSI